MSEIIIRLPGKPEKVGRLSDGIYRIGSSPAAHIQLSLPEVSSRHALLAVRGSEVTLEDAGSTNGTFLDNKRVGTSAVPVNSGAVIRIGSAEIIIRLRSEQEAPISPPSPGVALSPPGAGVSVSLPIKAGQGIA